MRASRLVPSLPMNTHTALVVVAAALIRDGKVFCARRGPGGREAFRWEFPGGKVEPGESPEAALAREFREELLVEVTIGDRLWVTELSRPGHALTLSVYAARLETGEPSLTEHLEARWLGPGELAALDWAEADRPALASVEAWLRTRPPR